MHGIELCFNFLHALEIMFATQQLTQSNLEKWIKQYRVCEFLSVSRKGGTGELGGQVT